MIYINLLDYRSIYNRLRIKKQFLIGTLSLLITLGLLGFVTSKKNNEIRSLLNTKKKKQNELNMLRAQVRMVKEFEEKEDALKEMLRVIKELKKNQAATSLILDNLNKQLSAEVWLTKLNETNGKLSLNGYSFSNPGIATFMKRLELSPYFEHVELIGSEQNTIGKEKLKKFTITLSLNIPSS